MSAGTRGGLLALPWGRLGVAALAVLACSGTAAQDAPAADAAPLQARRQVLEQQRQAVEAQHRAAAAQCEQRFAINACLAEADQARRKALAPLRQESLALDDVERQSRAMARAHQAAQRQQLVAQRIAPSASSAAAPMPAAPPARVVDAAPAEPVAVLAPRSGPSAEATALALQRAAAAEKRRARAAADRERIAAKQAERARSSASSPGLPVPQSAFKP